MLPTAITQMIIYCLYLLLMNAFNSVYVILAFFVYQSVIKIIQLQRSNHTLLYFLTPWNLLDIIRILTMFTYLICVLEENEAYVQNSYSFLTLVSWISVLNYLRIFSAVRVFIELVNKTIKSLTQLIFTYVILVATAFFLAFYQQNKHEQEGDEHIQTNFTNWS